MSTQSIYENSKENLSYKVDDLYMDLGYKFIINLKYGIGNLVDLSIFKNIKRLERLSCEENCLLCDRYDLIREKLNLLLLNCKNGV